MNEYLDLANVRVLLWLNHALAAHPRLYRLGLFLTDEGADLALLVTAGWLWFWPGRPLAFQPAGARYQGPATRRESRARLIVFGVAGVAAYIVARLIAISVNADRPFVTYLPVRGVAGSFEGLRTFGTFPSDHAALLGALPVAFVYWNRGLGLAWALLALFLVLVRIAVGFHYPSDMLAGAGLGVIAGGLAMVLYDRVALVHRLANTIAAGFSRPPYAYVLYGLLILVGVEFAMHFKHVLGFLVSLRYRIG